MFEQKKTRPTQKRLDSLIGSGTRVDGDIVFSGGLRVGGIVHGKVSMAKLYGGVQANQIVDRVLQIHGGMGYTRELPVERWYRELRLLRIYEGTDEILKLKVAASVRPSCQARMIGSATSSSWRLVQRGLPLTSV